MMKRPLELAAHARFLKANGDSVRVIADKLQVPRSTVGDWVRGMDIEPVVYRECAGPRCAERFATWMRTKRYCCKLCQSRRRAQEMWEERNAA